MLSTYNVKHHYLQKIPSFHILKVFVYLNYIKIKL